MPTRRTVIGDRVDTVWDTIALHMSPVYQRRRAPEIGIAMGGTGIDVLGGPDALPPGYADRVLAVYPRPGGTRVLTDAIVRHAMSDPRKALPTTLPGEVLPQRHPSRRTRPGTCCWTPPDGVTDETSHSARQDLWAETAIRSQVLPLR